MIGLKTYQKNIGELQKAFKQNYTAEQEKRLFESLMNKEESQLKKAIDWLILNKTRLPFPGEVINAVDEERNKEWREKKYKEQGQAEDFFGGRTSKTENGRKALALIKLVLGVGFKPGEKPMTVPELYRGMLQMNDDFPGNGWRTEANKLPNERAIS